MANKKITDLQLRGSIIDGLYFPSDDAIQSYRVSALMLKNYIRPHAITALKTATYTADAATDDMVLVGTNAFTLTLPTAVGNTGKVFWIKKTTADTNLITIATTSAQTIDGDTNKYLVYKGDEYAVMSDGSNWHVTSRVMTPQYLSATSSDFALNTAGYVTLEYPAHSGNSVTLPPRTSWKLMGFMLLRDAGTDATVTEMVGQWATANGNNTSTVPAALSQEAGPNSYIYKMASGFEGAYPVAPIRYTTAGTSLVVYLNTRVAFSAAGNGEIRVIIYGERVG